MKKALFYLFLTISLFSCKEENCEHDTSIDPGNYASGKLFMYKEVQTAFENHSRDKSGMPGDYYFQNRPDYIINVELDPKTRTITGSEKISYKNNSRDSLDKIVLKLDADIFKKGGVRLSEVSKDDVHDGVKITKIVINGDEIDINSGSVINSASLLTVTLKNKLLPGSESNFEFDWSFKLNTHTFRMGTYEKNNFFVAYWYPQMVVYDDVNGWSAISYNGYAEFYNEFSDYEVNVTVPGDYQVWSSGIIQNPEEVYSPEILERYTKSLTSDSVIHIISPEDRASGKIKNSKGKVVWKYKAENLPAFAFAASSLYLWDATSIQSGERKVSVNAVYKPTAKTFQEVASMARETVEYLTNEFPGLPFPYPIITAFNGDGAMEHPGMVNDVETEDLKTHWYITCHEIGHQFFPFYVGINEQRYAWMDEAITTLYSRELVDIKVKENNTGNAITMVQNYVKDAGTRKDIPPTVNSNNASEAYRTESYHRTSVALYVLREIVGNEKFRESYQEFIKNWNGKHPIPEDFFNTFNRVCNQDLSWFWKPWFFEFGYPDLAIGGIEEHSVKIEKIGTMPVSILLKVEYQDGSEDEFNEKPDIWKNGNTSFSIKTDSKKLIKGVKLGNNLIPDADLRNNNVEKD